MQEFLGKPTVGPWACGAANSAALLLRSANDHHPNGLANGSGQVGRSYMFHNSQAVLALSLTPNDTMFQKTLALNDFYFGMEGVVTLSKRRGETRLLCGTSSGRDDLAPRGHRRGA
jgi:choline dehydrogenase-like flavoprotein